MEAIWLGRAASYRAITGHVHSGFMHNVDRWYSEEPEDAGGWGSPAYRGRPDLMRAARAARTIGKVDRTHRDKIIAVAYFVFAFVGVCGLYPLLLLAGLCWKYAAMRSRRLDARPWATATPVAGARRFLVSEVTVAHVVAVNCRRHRWWQIVDENNVPVFGIFGVKKGSPGDICIAPSTGLLPLGLDPLTVPGFWGANSTIYRSQHEKGFTILHLCRATGEPVLAVRFTDPTQRRGIEVLVYAPEVLEDLDMAVLSCAAIFVKSTGPRRTGDMGMVPAATSTSGDPCQGSNSPHMVDGGYRAAEAAWPRAFLGHEMTR